jgi:hypothetical protein
MNESIVSDGEIHRCHDQICAGSGPRCTVVERAPEIDYSGSVGPFSRALRPSNKQPTGSFLLLMASGRPVVDLPTLSDGGRFGRETTAGPGGR